MFGKGLHLKGAGGQEKQGAIDDITAILIVLNTKLDKSMFFGNNANTSS
jgi:hypothetical protein